MVLFSHSFFLLLQLNLIFPFISHTFLNETGAFCLNCCPRHCLLVKLMQVVAPWNHKTLVIFEVGIAVLRKSIPLGQLDICTLQNGSCRKIENKASISTAALLLANATKNENFFSCKGDRAHLRPFIWQLVVNNMLDSAQLQDLSVNSSVVILKALQTVEQFKFFFVSDRFQPTLIKSCHLGPCRIVESNQVGRASAHQRLQLQLEGSHFVVLQCQDLLELDLIRNMYWPWLLLVYGFDLQGVPDIKN